MGSCVLKVWELGRWELGATLPRDPARPDDHPLIWLRSAVFHLQIWTIQAIMAIPVIFFAFVAVIANLQPAAGIPLTADDLESKTLTDNSALKKENVALKAEIEKTLALAENVKKELGSLAGNTARVKRTQVANIGASNKQARGRPGPRWLPFLSLAGLRFWVSQLANTHGHVFAVRCLRTTLRS